MERSSHFGSQPLRGKNWSDRETRIFIQVLEKFFPKLQGRCRKGKVYDQIASQLRDQYGILRTSKEVQNKYKSIVREYRIALAQYVRDKGSAPSSYKWFIHLHAFMKHTISSESSTSTWDFAASSTTEKHRSESVDHASENLRMASPTVYYTEPLQDHPQVNMNTTAQHNAQRELADSTELLPTRELQLEGTLLPSAKNLLLRKRRFTSKDDENYGNMSLCAWRSINNELKEHTKVSTQVQEKICNSLENFNQVIQSLSGALSIIPNLFSQLVQCTQAHQLSHFSQQNRQTASIMLSPLSQPNNQQIEQNAGAQYIWLYDPSINVTTNKATLPGP